MIWKYLQQRYPCKRNDWKIIIPISVFISLFLIIFQPFGLNELELKNKMLILAGYGAVTFVILLINMILIPALMSRTFSDENWTVFKEMLFLIWILFTIGLGNFIYSAWTIGFKLTWLNIMIFQAYTLAIGILPITAIIIAKQNFLKHKNEERAKIISSNIHDPGTGESKDGLVLLQSDNGKESLEVMVHNLLFIKSDGNYITAGYLVRGKFASMLFRNTLKYAEDLLAEYPSIYKTHRSWLVNLDRISRVTGNSQGLKIIFEGFEEEIPVARSISSDFRQKMTGKD